MTERADIDLVTAELARLAAVQAPDGYERAYVREQCLRRLGVTDAAAVLRQELLLQLAGEPPWHGPDSPAPTWYTERHRIAYLALLAGVRGRVPEDHECRTMIHVRRMRRLALERGEI